MIRLGIVGCGSMAKTHTDRFDRLASRVQVTAAVDANSDRAKAAARLLGDAKVATDFREILDDVDAVLLVLPHHLHHPIGLACLQAGKHVLMEKPLANSEPACLELIETADREGRVLMTAYCMRYHPLVLRLKEVLDARTFGDVFQISLWTEQLTRYLPDHWASRAATLGGGQLFSHGCHYVDLLLWMLGRPETGTHLGTNFGTPWMENEGTSHVTIKFAGGALGYHFGTWGARGTRHGTTFHALCTEGMLEANFATGQLSAILGNSNSVLFECDGSKHTENELAHFLDCIETGKTPLTDARSSLQSLRVIWRLYEAERQGVVADLRGLELDAVAPPHKR